MVSVSMTLSNRAGKKCFLPEICMRGLIPLSLCANVKSATSWFSSSLEAHWPHPNVTNLHTSSSNTSNCKKLALFIFLFSPYKNQHVRTRCRSLSHLQGNQLRLKLGVERVKTHVITTGQLKRFTFDNYCPS